MNFTANCSWRDEGSPPDAEMVLVILPAFGLGEPGPVYKLVFGFEKFG